jgi:hypothetical protein
MTMLDRALLLSDRFSALDNQWEHLPTYILVRMAALIGDGEPLYVDGDATY